MGETSIEKLSKPKIGLRLVPSANIAKQPQSGRQSSAIKFECARPLQVIRPVLGPRSAPSSEETPAPLDSPAL